MSERSVLRFKSAAHLNGEANSLSKKNSSANIVL